MGLSVRVGGQMMKTILFNAYSDEDYPRRLDLVLDLARYLDGHLTLLNSMPFETTVSADPYGAAFAAMVPIWREEARNLRKKSEVDLANENVPWDWIEDSGPVSHAMLRRSALTDIIVLGAREPSAAARRAARSICAKGVRQERREVLRASLEHCAFSCAQQYPLRPPAFGFSNGDRQWHGRRRN